MIQTALRNPYLVIVVALAVLVLGVVSYQRIPADLLPMFETSAVQIVTFYPGMPPEVMEKDIMSRLQRWTGQSVGISHQEAKAMQGVCIVKDYFREGISMDTAMSQVTSYAMSDMFYLPPGTIPPMVMPFDPTASVPLCLVVVSNPQMDEQELYDIAYFELRNKLQSIQGVIAPAVYGGKLRRILAYVDGRKLEAYGMSLIDVQQALLKQNVLIPAGNIKIGKQDLQIFTNAIPDRVEKLNDTPIKVVNGVPVLMRDIGKVENSHQIQSNIVRINKQRQVYIPIYRQPGANTIEIVKRINTLLPGILTRLQNERSEDPKMATLVLSVAMDQSQGVVKSINGLQIAAGLGAILAGLVVFLFLRDIRSTFVVILAIPLAVLAALIGIFFNGATINAMTLGGLALAIGILVDQSIVVLENVTRHARMGKTPSDAALDGTREVALPIFVSTLTFIVVFVPVVFLSGMAKYLFTPLAMSASIAILASYVISITLIPAYCAKFLRVQPRHSQDDSATAQSSWLAGALKAVIAARYLVVGGALAGLFFCGLLLMRTGRELIPPIESPQFTIYVRMPTGTNIDETERQIKQIEQVIIDRIGEPDPAYALGPENEKIPSSNLQLLISNLGVLMDWPAAYTPNTGPMDAFMLIQLKGKRGMDGAFTYVDDLRLTLNEQFPDVDFAFDTGGMMTAALNMGEPSPIHFQIAASNLPRAQKIARIIQQEAMQVEGAHDVRIAQRIDYPALYVEVDREAAAQQGLTPEDVMKNLVAATNSTINFEPSFWIDPYKGNHYFFGVQYREESLNSVKTLLDIPVAGNWNTPRRLGNVATITKTEGPAVVNHRNITRVTDVYVNVDPAHDVGGVCEQIEKRLLNNRALAAVADTDERGSLYRLGKAKDGGEDPADHEFKGLTFRMQGEVREMRDSFRQFGSGLGIAAILVYLVMVAQFRSFIDPFIILLTIPLGFIGVVLILVATNTNLSIMSFMGIIMVVGIVVEYSIVLVDFANHRLEDGLTVHEAIIDATLVRLRPILMTSLTTWLALLPMAFGFAGGEANAPLARAIIGGVLGATFLSLLVVPCLYVMLKQTPKKELPAVAQA
jgi:multidrug efflux pump subunit AcrB